MSKTLIKIAIVLILLLSGGSVYLSYELYKQREQLKGRTLTLEEYAKKVAGTIEVAEESTARVTLPDDQLRTFKEVPGGPPNMRKPLDTFATLSAYQRQRLETTRQVLAATKATLAEREEELALTKKHLADAKDRIQHLEQTLTERENTISEQTVKIQGLEADKATLTQNVEEQKVEIENLGMRISSLETQYAEATNKIAELTILAYPEKGTEQLVRGEHGEVVYVDPVWNFVILNAGDNTRFYTPRLPLLIHRNDQFVGKVEVASVLKEAQLVVAEILPDWQRLPFREGDRVLY